MISGELIGRLGNMMFEIAAIESMGQKTGIKTCYPNVNLNINELRKPQACTSEMRGHEYFGLFKNFSWHKNLDGDTHYDETVSVPLHYMPLDPKDYTRYIGYFQSELYFPDRDFILNLFEPADFIKEQLKKYVDVIGVNKASIHVRRGDYLKMSNIYNILDMGYYARAIAHLKAHGVKEFLIFSNDKQWCRDNFKGEEFIVIDDDVFIELFLMGMTAHNIIANSAFSWWGAWLNNNPSRKIIAPGRWFVDDRKEDIIPKNWIKL